MGVRDELKALVDELDRVHRGAMPWTEEVGLPDFATAENGMERYFSRKAREALWQFSSILHQNRPPCSPKIELEGYEKIVRQAVADMHAADKFSRLDDSDRDNLLPKLKSFIEERVACIANEYTHYFPAWTLGMEKASPYSLGPVTFLSRTDWIDSVDSLSEQRTII